MCGIVGKMYLAADRPVDRTDLHKMLETVHHRGPDANGIYIDQGVGLGHARLSIIDVEAGIQPMTNEDKTVWIVFNGEIYNFQALREDLISRGHQFRNRSDTEVIIHLYEEYGNDCVKHLRGMFAFAIWDQSRRKLLIARDRLGIKPLYYHLAKHSFSFGSELKALIFDPTFPKEVDLDGVRRFLSFHYVPGEMTLFRQIRKLLPGHILTVEAGEVKIQRYWDLTFTSERYTHSFEDAAVELHELLSSTVHDHMIADVPVGVLLSGGVDSTAVLNFAVQGTTKRVQTFTVGFDEPSIVDERPFARIAAERYGTTHHEITVTPRQFWEFLPKFVWHMEEPVCEPPAVALYYISKLAQKHVKVLLSGEGGDEAFAGYPNYRNMLRLDAVQRKLGPAARAVGLGASIVARLVGSSRLDRYGNYLGRPLADSYFSRTSSPASPFNQRAKELLSDQLLSATEAETPAPYIRKVLNGAAKASLLNQMLYIDTATWLPDDLLLKADKMTMANSVELRVPLLDHKILEFAASIKPEFKCDRYDTKKVLKAALRRAVPSEILNRKKAGFPLPITKWITEDESGFLRENLLSKTSLTRSLFSANTVNRFIERSDPNDTKSLFGLLVLELWYKAFSSRS